MVDLWENGDEKHQQHLQLHLRYLLALLAPLLVILPVQSQWKSCQTIIFMTWTTEVPSIKFKNGKSLHKYHDSERYMVYLRLEHESYSLRKAFNTELRYRNWRWSQSFLMNSVPPEKLISEEWYYSCWTLHLVLETTCRWLGFPSWSPQEGQYIISTITRHQVEI